MVPEILLFSKRRWDVLSEEDQALVAAAAKASLPIMRGFHREREAAARQHAEDAGTIFVRDVDKASFQSAMRPVYDRFVVTAQQKALVQAIRAMQ
jgi:TRAP-type C4-dicarboxylate transport system substrate-binding protein